MKTEHCGDRSPHGPHTWYAPKRGGGQEQLHCPGTPKRK